MKIGSDVPDVTWTELRWVLRLGMARPSTRPSAIASDDPHRQEPVEERQAGDDRLDVGPPRLGRRSETTSLTACLRLRVGADGVQQHDDEPAAASTGSGREPQHADSPGAAERSWPAGISVSARTV